VEILMPNFVFSQLLMNGRAIVVICLSVRNGSAPATYLQNDIIRFSFDFGLGFKINI